MHRAPSQGLAGPSDAHLSRNSSAVYNSVETGGGTAWRRFFACLPYADIAKMMITMIAMCRSIYIQCSNGERMAWGADLKVACCLI